MEDSMILEALQKNGEQGYILLMAQYMAYVTAIISGMAKGALSTSDMEEVAADVFFKAWQKRAQIRPGSLKPWMAQVARNATVDRLRKLGKPPVPYEEDILQGCCGGQPDELMMAREQKQIMAEAMETFGEPDREVFIRFYYYGEPVAAISQKLDLTQAGIKTKLHRLRAKLRAILIERGYGHVPE